MKKVRAVEPCKNCGEAVMGDVYKRNLGLCDHCIKDIHIDPYPDYNQRTTRIDDVEYHKSDSSRPETSLNWRVR